VIISYQKESGATGTTIAKFNLHFRAIAITTAWYWHKTDMKTSGTEDPDMNQCSYTHLIFDKGAENI
jgi:hypothetical protein